MNLNTISLPIGRQARPIKRQRLGWSWGCMCVCVCVWHARPQQSLGNCEESIILQMCLFSSVGSCQNLFGCPKNCLVMWYLVVGGVDLFKASCCCCCFCWILASVCVCLCVCVPRNLTTYHKKPQPPKPTPHSPKKKIPP
jgi:hypothetical protein